MRWDEIRVRWDLITPIVGIRLEAKGVTVCIRVEKEIENLSLRCPRKDIDRSWI